MTAYQNELKVKDALQVYFSKYHFVNGGYEKKWFTIKLGPIFIPLPNIKDRVDAVKIHDIHHLVTEYNADLKGEAEIGAWEIASGCGKYYVAWLLNLGSILIGLLFYQKALLNALLKGRKCITNFYYNFTYDDALLNKSVGELRSLIEPISPPKSSIKDYLLFIFWCVVTIIYHVIIVIAIYKVVMTLVHFHN